MQYFVYGPHFSINNEKVFLPRFSCEVFASELLENVEEMFHRYYLYGDMFTMFKCSMVK